MSQSGGMTGFTWPSRAGSSPSHATPSSSSVLILSPAMTPTASATDAPLSSLSAAVSATSGSNSSSSSTASPTSTGLQRTTHVQVTHTVIVTPTVTVGVKSPPVGASTTEYERGTSFSMSQPLATTAITDNFPLSTTAPNQEDTASGSSNLGPMIGGTVAVVGGIMLIFLLYKYCKRSKAKSSDVELGQLPSTRSRERQGVSRSVPMSHNYGVNPIAVANAMNWQDSKGVQHEARDTARGAGKASTLDIRQSDLAQAQGWDRPFDADGFQVSRTYGGSSTGPSSRVRLPKHVPPRKPVPAAHPVGKQRHDTQHISPVSPLTEEEARHRGPTDYSKVSPLNSPTGRRSGWAS
ncbi:hypothetical protein Ptr902_07416 [Pyrenophora tritici-repentis]|nr:hypothetical protein Ptr902_07416 [Pyrenophora tritici-repentis]